MAYHLQQQGYSLNWTSDHTFEIDGYSKDQLEEFSSRRQEIRDYLDHQHIKLEQATEAQKTIACLESRAAKVHKLSPIDHERQHQAWIKLADELGIEHPVAASKSRELISISESSWQYDRGGQLSLRECNGSSSFMSLNSNCFESVCGIAKDFMSHGRSPE